MTNLLRTHLLLCLVFTVSLFCGLFMYNHPLGSPDTDELQLWHGLSMIVGGVLMVSALTVLLSTFLEIDIRPDGTWCYPRTSKMWRLVNGFHRKEKTDEHEAEDISQIKLCKCYWTIVLYMLSVALVSTLVIGFIVLVFTTHLHQTHYQSEPWSKSDTEFTVMVFVFLAYVIMMTGACAKKMWKTFGVLLGLFQVAVLVVLPLYGIRSDNPGFDLMQAAKLYGIYVAEVLFCGMILGALVYALVIVFDYIIKYVKNSWLWRLINNELCPTLYACSLPQSNQEVQTGPEVTGGDCGCSQPPTA